MPKYIAEVVEKGNDIDVKFFSSLFQIAQVCCNSKIRIFLIRFQLLLLKLEKTPQKEREKEIPKWHTITNKQTLNKYMKFYFNSNSKKKLNLH